MEGERTRQETRGLQPEGRGGQVEGRLHGDVLTGSEAYRAAVISMKGDQCDKERLNLQKMAGSVE